MQKLSHLSSFYLNVTEILNHQEWDNLVLWDRSSKIKQGYQNLCLKHSLPFNTLYLLHLQKHRSKAYQDH